MNARHGRHRAAGGKHMRKQGVKTCVVERTETPHPHTKWRDEWRAGGNQTEGEHLARIREGTEVQE